MTQFGGITITLPRITQDEVLALRPDAVEFDLADVARLSNGFLGQKVKSHYESTLAEKVLVMPSMADITHATVEGAEGRKFVGRWRNMLPEQVLADLLGPHGDAHRADAVDAAMEYVIGTSG